MPLKSSDIESLLQSKFGFTEAPTRSRDHRWYTLHLPGLPAIITKVSHGPARTLSSDLEAKIARQLRVKRPYFQGMFTCSKSREDYYRQVHEEPYPPWEVRL